MKKGRKLISREFLEGFFVIPLRALGFKNYLSQTIKRLGRVFGHGSGDETSGRGRDGRNIVNGDDPVLSLWAEALHKNWFRSELEEGVNFESVRNLIFDVLSVSTRRVVGGLHGMKLKYNGI